MNTVISIIPFRRVFSAIFKERHLYSINFNSLNSASILITIL